jgi:coenzyme F420-reducing hydrogenase delta subunit/ferredoxin-like protein FixX
MTEHPNKLRQTETVVGIDDDYCSRCLICPSVCPFDALSTEGDSGQVKLDAEKCQVCGLCYAACPASAIETVYYNVDPLLKYINAAMGKKRLDKLVLTCRGASLLERQTSAGVERTPADDSILLRLPCVGRVPPELLLRALSLGIKKITIQPCEDKHCRFKDGGTIGTRRFLLVKTLLNQLGFRPDTLTVTKQSIKAHVDAYRCIGCGNCHYTCAFDAIKMEPPGVAQINPEACSGCGACAGICPVFAIKLDGSEYETISQAIRSYKSLIPMMKQKIEKPVILVLLCDWSEFSDLDSPKNPTVENAVFLELPCAGRVDPLHVLEALYSGFDGVLIAACKKGECKLEKGNEKAENCISSLKRLLAQVNLDRKVEICFVSPKNIGDFDQRIRSFAEKMNPLTVREHVSK